MRYRYWLLISASLFIIGMAGGIVVFLTTPPGLTDFLSGELSALEKLSGMLAPFQVGTILFIFFKNTAVLLLSFALSPIFFLFPVLVLTLNGLLLSFVAILLAGEKSAGYVLAGILPHGIIEIPAIIIGEAAALSFGLIIIMGIFNSQSRVNMMTGIKRNLKILGIAVALLFPAAIIETYITPLLIT